MAEEEPRKRHRALMWPLTAVAFLSGLAAAAGGFALSYGALRDAAVAWGYLGWKSYAFPVAVDGLIIALYTADLVLSWKRMSRPWVRATAHALTGVTIGLNVWAVTTALPGSPSLAQALDQDFGRIFAHAMMPVAYVILTEVARWAIVRTARLESGLPADQALTVADWTMNFRVTWHIFKYAKTYPAPYAEARAFVRDLAVYRIWQKERAAYAAGTPEARARVLDRMPALLAPYGVSVERAREIPAEMLAAEEAQEEERRQAERAKKQELEQQKRDEERAERERTRERERQEAEEKRERERQAREDAHQARLAQLAMEAEEARQQGEVAALKATADGQARAAAHRAEGTVAEAEILASTARTKAERAAAQAVHQAVAEERAEESAKIVAARAKETAERAKEEAERAKLAEARVRIVEAERTKAEEEAKLLAERAKQDAERAKEAEATRLADEAEQQAALVRERTAALVLRAAEAEALSALSARELRVRIVARMLLDSVPAEQAAVLAPQELALFLKDGSPVTGAQVAQAIGGGSPATASEHKADALKLIARGYNHHLRRDPDIHTQQ
ncbi:DUF2637 domain-containing protein [Streptomyces cinereoruber]|uniref:DUF2637 domain-containing protein n=1 Tax=Streptomyces cinereoruber TaxID=67260 RepID=UPI003648E079